MVISDNSVMAYVYTQDSRLTVTSSGSLRDGCVDDTVADGYLDNFGYIGGFASDQAGMVVVNEASATISAAGPAVDLTGDSPNLTNLGDIASSSDDGVHIEAANARVQNSGNIYGQIGLYVNSLGPTDIVTNTGTISGIRDAVEQTGNGTFVFQNSGTINGNVQLGSGVSSFDSHDGFVNGTIYGGSGCDYLFDSLNHATMAGGAGDDTYFVYSPLDRVIEHTNGGRDTVVSTFSYALSANLENLTLGGTSDLRGRGNALANTIVGNDGNDVINGAGGLDTLTGGAGKDTFVFSSVLDPERNLATLPDFTAGSDMIALSHNIFSGAGAKGALSSSAFTIGDAASTTAQHVIYNPLSGALSYDPDGSGAAPQVQFAQLLHNLPLHSTDFKVI